MKRIYWIIILIHITSFAFSQKQEGNYFGAFFTYQVTNIANNKDAQRAASNISSYAKWKTTVKPAWGINYFYNSKKILGFETGCNYSLIGQDYYGHLDYDGNDSTRKDFDWNSSLNLQYINVPLILLANTQLSGDEQVFISFGIGLQFDFLTHVNIQVDPYPKELDELNLNYKDFLRFFNVSSVMKVRLNYQTWGKIGLWGEVKVFKSLGNIRNNNFNYTNKDYPMEIYFPLSTKKETRPNIAYDKYKSKNFVFGGSIGLYYKFKK